MNISPQPYIKKEAQPTLGIEKYLKELREGVVYDVKKNSNVNSVRINV